MKGLLKSFDSIDYGSVWNTVSPFLLRIVVALLLFFVGRKIVKAILKVVDRICVKRLDKGVEGFLRHLIGIALNLVVLVAVADVVGIPTTSLIALIGSLGLAVGLSLQGSLSNFAGGILILLTKPFVVGDFICVSGFEGTVTDIGVCYTKLHTIDNRVVVLPNGSLSNSNLINVNQEPLRRIDMVIPIGYQDDIRAMKSLLERVASANVNVLKDQPVTTYVKEFGADSINLGFRVWVQREMYWDTLWEIQESVRYAMKEQGFTIPFRQMDVTLVNAEQLQQKSGDK